MFVLFHKGGEGDDRFFSGQNNTGFPKSAQASLETFALSTQNQEAKNLFTQAAQQTSQIVQQVESRVQQLENEEPQYKGF